MIFISAYILTISVSAFFIPNSKFDIWSSIFFNIIIVLLDLHSHF